ncbi:unnamed protein product, partial [Durusdinium trenchii]
AQYQEFLRCAECCEEAASLSNGTIGRREGKALRLFDELKDEREVAVCHFYMADLALQEQSIPGAPPLSNLVQVVRVEIDLFLDCLFSSLI